MNDDRVRQNLDMLLEDVDTLGRYVAQDAPAVIEAEMGRDVIATTDNPAPEFSRRMVIMANELRALAVELVDATGAALQAKALEAALTVESMNEETDALAGATMRAQQSLGANAVAAVRNVISWIKGQLKKLGAQLWRLISKLLTPKEWQLKGSVSTAPFGLASAEISITFG